MLPDAAPLLLLLLLLAGLSLPASAYRLLYRADFTSLPRIVTEDTLCGGIPGGHRKRLPSADEDWVLESGFIPAGGGGGGGGGGPAKEGPGISFATAEANGSGMRLHNNGSHLVLWNTRPFPVGPEVDVELRFGVEPQNDTEGLNIVFFAASTNSTGESIFALDVPPRRGNYSRYTKGSLNAYSDSYFRPDGKAGPGICDRDPQGRCAANLRKNPGFHLVAAGEDVMEHRGQRVYEVHVRRSGRDGVIELLVDNRTSVRWTDSSPLPAPGMGFVGLRQMAHTGSSLYTFFEVWGE